MRKSPYMPKAVIKVLHRINLFMRQSWAPIRYAGATGRVSPARWPYGQFCHLVRQARPNKFRSMGVIIETHIIR